MCIFFDCFFFRNVDGHLGFLAAILALAPFWKLIFFFRVYCCYCFNLCIWNVNKKKIPILFRIIKIFEKITDNQIFVKIKGHKSCNFSSNDLKICIQMENTFSNKIYSVGYIEICFVKEMWLTYFSVVRKYYKLVSFQSPITLLFIDYFHWNFACKLRISRFSFSVLWPY